MSMACQRHGPRSATFFFRPATDRTSLRIPRCRVRRPILCGKAIGTSTIPAPASSAILSGTRPDLIEQIMQAKVGHEIGSHSFSHIDFSSQTSGRELVEREMQQCLDLMAPLGLKLRSLVYPFNHMGHQYHDLLRRLGIVAVRHRDDKVRLSYPLRSAAGVYQIYESMNLRSPNLYDYRNKAELFIDHAIQHWPVLPFVVSSFRSAPGFPEGISADPASSSSKSEKREMSGPQP